MSFDKGFTRQEDRELLNLYIPEVIMPKRGKKNAQETEREKSKKFVALRRQHSAVESQINALEHHGLDRCLDVSGWKAICVMSATACWPTTSIRSGKNSSKVGAVSRRRLKKAPAAKKNEVSQEQCVSKGWNFSANRGKRKKRSVSLTNDFILIDVPCYFSTKTRVFCRTLIKVTGLSN